MDHGERSRMVFGSRLRDDARVNAEGGKIKHANVEQLKEILHTPDIRNERPEIIDALLRRVMVNGWVTQDSTVGPTSWQHQYARSDLYKLLTNAISPSTAKGNEATGMYEDLAARFDTFSAQSHVLSEYSQDLLKTILSGTSSRWLLNGAVHRLNHPDVLPGLNSKKLNHGEDYHAYHRILNWQKAYREVLFGEYSTSYQDEFIKKCDQLSHSPDGSGKAIQLLRESVFGSRTMHFYRKDGNRIEAQVIKKLVEEKRGTYFFHLFSQAVLSQLERGENLDSPHIRDETLLPFRVSKNLYGYFRKFGGERVLLVSKPAESAEISRLLAQLKALEPELKTIYKRREELAASHGGVSDIDNWPIDSALEYQRTAIAEEKREALENQLRSFFLEKSSKDYFWGAPRQDRVFRPGVMAGGDHMSGIFELFANDVRHIIEKKLGVRLDDISLVEQIYFLKFADQASPHQGQDVETFVEKFDVNGLRTFLASSVASNAPENILAFAKKADQEITSKIFTSYARSIDAADAIAKQVRLMSKEMGHEEPNALLEKIPEVVLRRAAQLFTAGMQMADGSYEGKESLVDLQKAYEGLAIGLQVIAQSLTWNNVTRYEVRGPFSLTIHTEINSTVFPCKIFIRTEPEEGKKSRQKDPSKTVTLSPRINFEIQVPSAHPLHSAFSPHVSHEHAKNDREAKRANISAIRIAFDLDRHVDGTTTCSADFGRGRDDDRYGDVLGRIFDTVESHRLTTGLNEFATPSDFAKAGKELSRIVLRNVSRGGS